MIVSEWTKRCCWTSNGDRLKEGVDPVHACCIQVGLGRCGCCSKRRTCTLKTAHSNRCCSSPQQQTHVSSVSGAIFALHSQELTFSHRYHLTTLQLTHPALHPFPEEEKWMRKLGEGLICFFLPRELFLVSENFHFLSLAVIWLTCFLEKWTCIWNLRTIGRRLSSHQGFLVSDGGPDPSLQMWNSSVLRLLSSIPDFLLFPVSTTSSREKYFYILTLLFTIVITSFWTKSRHDGQQQRDADPHVDQEARKASARVESCLLLWNNLCLFLVFKRKHGLE